MLTKENLKMAFAEICFDECVLDVADDIYNESLSDDAEERGIMPGTEAYEKVFNYDAEKVLPWLVDRLATDKVLDYVNSHMKYVPIVELRDDEYFDEIIHGIKDVQTFFKREHGKKVELMPNLFDMKACRVGSTCIPDMCGFVSDVNYSVGVYVTYILENGTVVIVEEKSFSVGNYEEEPSAIFRRIVDIDYGLLNLLDDLFDADFKGLFDV